MRPTFPSTILGNLETAPKRRVFFSFHYQNDINRVNVVRQSWRFRPGNNTSPTKFFDSSLWERTKRSGPDSLKRLIRTGLQNTSVTCVLAGAETWARPWVRFEIAESLRRGNGLLTVYVDGVPCMKSGLAPRGQNPLDYLGLARDESGKAFIWESFGGEWRRYPLLTHPVPWPAWLPNVGSPNLIQPLSAGALSYDYRAHDGYRNLSTWAQRAAQQARK